MPDPIELIGGGQTGRAGSDDGHAPPGAHDRRPGLNPAFGEGSLDDRQLDVLDRHRFVVDAEHARSFARRRAQSTREIGKVIRGVQAIAGGAPALPIHEVVPVRDLVSERATLVTERDAAVHAARALIADFRLRGGQVHLVPVEQAQVDRPLPWFRPLDVDETGDVTHATLRPVLQTPARDSRTAPWPRRREHACSRAG